MSKPILILALITAALLGYGFYQAWYATPPMNVPVAQNQDPAVMGNIFRIFYYHVSSAWTGFLCFFVTFVASVAYLARRRPGADALAVSSAEVGVVFTTVVLVTGPIWAKPVWGIWWTWDARLTSTLVLWLIFVSYLMLRRFAAGGQTPVLAAVLAVFGFVDVPLVYMSIRWFRTQHPQPVIAGGPNSGIHPDMRYALMMNFLAFAALSVLLIAARYQLERRRQRLEEAFTQRALAEEKVG